MEEFNKYKEQEQNKIIIKIKEDEKKLLEINPKEKEYNYILNDLIILKKELDIFNKLTYEKYQKNIDSYSNYINKYGFITDLNEEQMKKFIYTINFNEKIKEFNITQEINIPDSLKDLKENFIKNNINPSKITDMNELSYMLDYTKKEYNNFRTKQTKLLEILNSLNIGQISFLRSDYISNKPPRKSNIEYFRTFGEDKIVDIIESELINLKEEENKIIKTESVKNNIIKIKGKIQKYLEYLLKQIYSDINYILNDYKDIIKIDSNNFINIRNTIYKIQNKVDLLDKDYNDLIRTIKNRKTIKETFIKAEQKHKNNIKDTLNSIVLGYNFTIKDLDSISEEKINEIISKNEVYDKISNKSFENNLRLS